MGIEKRVIYASSERFTLNLTLKNLVIKGGNVVGGTISENMAGAYGGGIYHQAEGGKQLLAEQLKIIRRKEAAVFIMTLH